ncbi:MAG: amidohydrolase [Nitrospirae bacterium YQR-1]
MSSGVEVDYLITGDYVLTMELGHKPIVNGVVAVSGGKIIDVGHADVLLSKYKAGRVLGGKGRVIIPGLINTHTHAAMVYFRGLADDLPLKEWLEGYIWPAEGRWLSGEFVADAITLACLEMMLNGITTYNDMYFFKESIAKTTTEMGMRAVLGAGILDFPTASAKNADGYLSNAENFINNWHKDTLITPAVSPHAPYTCGPDTFRKAKRLSERYGLPLHTHLSETQHEVADITKLYGKSPVEHLSSIGVLDSTVVAAHCVWVSDKEVDILSEAGVSVSHCVESNLKLASGIAPVVGMLKRGVNVAFGTDGAASNNDLDIFTEMSIAARLHKAVNNDPTVLTAKEALTMATISGATALGKSETIGSIKAGKTADLVILNLDKPHLTPYYDIYSLIVYSMRASDVETVMINGKLTVENKVCLMKDEGEIIEKARWWKDRIAAETKIGKSY